MQRCQSVGPISRLGRLPHLLPQAAKSISSYNLSRASLHHFAPLVSGDTLCPAHSRPRVVIRPWALAIPAFNHAATHSPVPDVTVTVGNVETPAGALVVTHGGPDGGFMFYALLDLFACPVCRASLILLDPEEHPQRTTMRLAPAQRLSQLGAIVGPIPGTAPDTPVRRLLEPIRTVPANDGRDQQVAIEQGVLLCIGCGRWYPIRARLPELLPDHLRNWEDDQAWLRTRQAHFGAGELAALWAHLWKDAQPPTSEANVPDEGAHYKQAEMAVAQRNLPEGFFAAAQVMPFLPSRPHFTLDLLARYVTTVSRLECGINGIILDLGVGYAWTTEWLVRLGYQAIGFDITRAYMQAALPRLGEHVPHLIIADAENLPLHAECVDATLSFDAFHHLPNRPRAMSELARVMRRGAKLVLVEPGKAHERHPQSIAVMQQHGILERGFDKGDLMGYIQSTPLGEIAHYRSDAHPHDVFVVQKEGVFETSSESPRLLSAEIDFQTPPTSMGVGQSPELTVSLTNLGDTTWLNVTPHEIGAVHLGAHLYDRHHTLLQEDYARIVLPRSLRPGQRLRVKFNLPPIHRSGDYLIEWDMVDNGFLWFKDFAPRIVNMPITVTAIDSEPIDAPALVEARAPRIQSVELSFEDKPRNLLRSPTTGRRLSLAAVPRIMWDVLSVVSTNCCENLSTNHCENAWATDRERECGGRGGGCARADAR